VCAARRRSNNHAASLSWPHPRLPARNSTENRVAFRSTKLPRERRRFAQLRWCVWLIEALRANRHFSSRRLTSSVSATRYRVEPFDFFKRLPRLRSRRRQTRPPRGCASFPSKCGCRCFDTTAPNNPARRTCASFCRCFPTGAGRNSLMVSKHRRVRPGPRCASHSAGHRPTEPLSLLFCWLCKWP